MPPPRPATDLRLRLPRLLLGLVMGGVGIACMVRAEVGLPPWAVLDQGLSRHTGIPIGTVGILVGVVVLCSWILLRERPGIGTVLNVLVIGLTTDLVLLVVDETSNTVARAGFLLVGVSIWGPGSGFYIGAGLGPGPRDGLMTGLAGRGVGSIRAVRTVLEVSALTLGWLLGGTVGIGTVVFALTIGPNVQFFLPRLTVRAGEPEPAVEPAAA